MPQRYTLKKTEKLKSRKRIDLLFKKGKSFSVFPYKVFYLITPAATSGAVAQDIPPGEASPNAPSPAGQGRSSDTPNPTSGRIPSAPGALASVQIGFGVSSRRFKKAVDRNRVKRLAREAWRLQKQPLAGQLAKKGLSMALFFVYIGKDLPDYSSITARIGVILQRLIKETA